MDIRSTSLLLALGLVSVVGCGGGGDSGARASDSGVAQDARPDSGGADAAVSGDLGPDSGADSGLEPDGGVDTGPSPDACPPGGCAVGCPQADPVDLRPGQTLSFDQNTSSGSRYLDQVDCQSMGLGGPQVLLDVGVTEPGDLVVALDANWDGARLAILDQACSHALGCGVGGQVIVPGVEPGVYRILVGGRLPQDQGPIHLEVALVARGLRAGTCAVPLELDGEAQGSLAGAVDVWSGTCSAEGAVESVHRFVAPEPGLYRFSVQADGWEPGLYLRTSCDDPDTELMCSGREAEVPLPAGPVSLFVEPVGAAPVGAGYVVRAELLPQGDGESCGTPAVVVPGFDGVATVRGDLSTALPDLEDDGCGTAGEPDLVYGIHLLTRAALRVSIQADGFVAVGLREDCDVPTQYCGNSRSGLVTPILDPGVHFLTVRLFQGDQGGPFTMRVEAVPAGDGPGNDRCDAPRALVVERGTMAAHEQGDTIVASDDYTGSCGGQGAPDLVYALDLDRASDLEIHLQAEYPSVVYLRGSCDDPGSEVACLSSGAVTRVRRAGPGTLFVVVDGQATGAAGTFSLDIGVTEALPPATNDTCDQASALEQLVERGHEDLEGDLTDATDQSYGTCSGRGRPELVYRLDLPDEARIRVENQGNGFNGFYLREGSCDGPEVGCGVGHLDVARIGPGTYYLFVESLWDPPEPYRVRVTYEPVPEVPDNDRCEGAEEVVIVDGHGSFSGDTSLGNDLSDATGYVNHCGDAGRSAPELFYRFVVDEPSRVDIVVDTRRFGFDGLVYLLPGCGMDPIACQDDPERLTLPRLEPGEYWLAVDGFGRNSGQFVGDITVEPLPPPGPGESCDQAVPVQPREDGWVAVGVMSDGVGALGDQACLGLPALDRFHLLHLDEVTRLSVTLVAPPHMALSVRAACEDPSGGVCVPPGSSVELELPAGDYYLIVRMPATAGDVPAIDYTVVLQTLPPEGEPPGGGCSEPVDLAVGVWRQRVVGTTVGARDEVAGSCGGALAPDTSYRLGLDHPALVTATLTAHGFDGVLRLTRGGCGAPEELGCVEAGQALAARLPAGEYLLTVDGARIGACGDYNLVVLQEPLADVGEACVQTGPGCVEGAFCVTSVGEGTRCVAPDPSTHVLWVADPEQGLIERLHPYTGEVLDVVRAPSGIRGPACGLALGDQGATLLLVDGGNPDLGIAVIDPFTGEQTGTLANPAGAGAAGLVAGPGRLALLDGIARVVHLVSPATGEVIDDVALPEQGGLVGGLGLLGDVLVVAMGEAEAGWDLALVPLPGAEGGGFVHLERWPVGGVATIGALVYVFREDRTATVLDGYTWRPIGTVSGLPSGCGAAGALLEE